MYRRRTTYDEWKCIIAKNRVGKVMDTADYSGYVGILNIHEVSETQIWRYNREDLTVCDNNYQ